MLNYYYSNAELQVAANLWESMGDVNELFLSLGRLVEVCVCVCDILVVFSTLNVTVVVVIYVHEGNVVMVVNGLHFLLI